MKKTYIIPNFTATELDNGSRPDIMDKKYRNMITSNSVEFTPRVQRIEGSTENLYYRTDPLGLAQIGESLTKDNANFDSPSFEIQYRSILPNSLVQIFDITTKFIPFAYKLDKQDTESYNCLAFQFNRLNPTAKKQLQTLYKTPGFKAELILTDNQESVEVDNNDYAPVDQTIKVGIVVPNAPNGTDAFLIPSIADPLDPVVLEISKDLIDVDGCNISINPEFFKDKGLLDRDGNPTDQVFHQYIILKIDVGSGNLSLGWPQANEVFSIGTVIASNAIEIRIDSETELEEDDLSRIETNEYGVDFVDEKNTIKKISTSLNLLDLEEFVFLKANFFNPARNKSFFLIASANSTGLSVNESKIYSGLYKYDNNEITIERISTGIYSIELELKEVV